jgi:hypothetical protein
MPQVGFEAMISVSEREKKAFALHHSATMIGKLQHLLFPK